MLAVVVPYLIFTVFNDLAADKLGRLRYQNAIKAEMTVLSEKIVPLVPLVLFIGYDCRREYRNTFIEIYNGLMLLAELVEPCRKFIEKIGCNVLDIYVKEILFPFIGLFPLWELAELVIYKFLERIEETKLCINGAGAYNPFAKSEIKADIVSTVQGFAASRRSAV